LEQQPRALEGDTSEQGSGSKEALDRANQSMERAQDSLEEGDISGALDKQADAMDALREGIKARNQGDQNAGEQTGENSGENQSAADQGQDPLGRPRGDSGTSGQGRSVLQNEALRKSQEVLDEIRRRSGEKTRPELELDYLERLLERF
jgi:hypothetical protein